MIAPFTATEAVIAARWPHLLQPLCRIEPLPATVEELGTVPALIVNRIHLSSSFDPESEAEYQCQQLIGTEPRVVIYGEQNGFLLATVLRRSPLAAVQVVVMNPALFRLYAEYYELAHLLKESRVELQLATTATQVNTTQPFVIAPSTLHFIHPSCSQLYNNLSALLNGSFVRAGFQQQEGRNRHNIDQNRPSWSVDPPVAALYHQPVPPRIHLLAAGPTLDDHREALKRAAAAGEAIIAVNTALPTLIRAGITPYAVLAIDSHPLLNAHFRDDSPLLAASALVYFPNIDPEIVRRWRGRRFVAVANQELFHRLQLYTPERDLFTYGSVIHPALDLAVRCGATEVYLYGCDFGFFNQRTHAADNPLIESVKNPLDWVMAGTGESIPTLPNLKSYLSGMELYIARHPECRFINRDRRGAYIQGTSYGDE